ncbi:hypothetical protein EV421DRAFT_1864498, partial [Armillaria borealis]
FLVETTCFVPPVAQCLRFGSCHRLEHCYRPTVCPADRGFCCLQLPCTCVLSFSYVSLPAIPLPGVLYLLSLFCLCFMSHALFCYSQVCCIVMSVAIWGPCICLMSVLPCFAYSRAGIRAHF